MTDYLKIIKRYLEKLFPIHRCITGEGNRESLRILKELIPLNILEYPSGTSVYDWTIPEEWGVCDAFIKNSQGEKIVDLQQSNLHVVSYSKAIHQTMGLQELKPHLHFLQELPEAVPYRTSYYKEDWGFCLTYHQYQTLMKNGGPFEVFIDASRKTGSLTAGELLIKGKNEQEVLISTYICHPSLANDNLSGMVLTAFLAGELLSRKNLNRSYRIIFVPETIGAIAYCAMNEQSMQAIDMGLVLTTVGGPGRLGYKQSFNKNHRVNKLIEESFVELGHDFTTYPFDIHGSDERQYSSPGFRINTATVCKDKYYEYPGYHTSLDNLDLVTAESIYQSFKVYLKLIDKLELESILPKARQDTRQFSAEASGEREVYLNRYPNCEVMLSRHNLYPETGGGLLPEKNSHSDLDLILWMLYFCDGQGSIDELSREISAPLNELKRIARLLEGAGLLEKVRSP